MSADVFVFHSSEVDDPALLRDGWYIVRTYSDDAPLADDAVGPYTTEREALDAMRAGNTSPA